MRTLVSLDAGYGIEHALTSSVFRFSEMRFLRKNECKRHEMTGHACSRPFVCTFCSAAFNRQDLRKRHILRTHEKVKGRKAGRGGQKEKENADYDEYEDEDAYRPSKRLRSW